MKKLLNDIKRGLTEPTFFHSNLILLCLITISGIYYFSKNNMYNADTAFITMQSLIIPFVAPIIVCLPYSSMNMLEQDSGYKRLIVHRIGYNKYVIMRFISNGFVGGVTLAFPLLILLVICRLISPYSQLGEVIKVICLDFGFGVSYSTIAYGLTFFNNKRYIPNIVPQVVYLLLTYSLPYLNLDKFYPPLSYAPWLLAYQSDIQSILIQFVILVGLGILGVIYGILYNLFYMKY
ncbi:hypothetical protein AN639_08260 [Candidatus Epulonipiscium fishelsonii]|uniref:Uncharacterized protein n=1 Tax=Candidatus Epulonipiscium fishelsonii TaxID=77094 RepID=A0ACC8XGX3_9FIRM|nr:hypothetical protein AN639_08260 [Epulopiscium sp. SCG-B05WGA-EpuloA1]ONI43027.1 hypothetical protein AN396_00255 [Epulopiscium sp. SCG-B11WGA-EpuloA1]